jgi:hypothetical protein
MPVFGSEPLDQLGGVAARLWELLAEPFAERGREGVDLTHGWLALLLHRGYQSIGRVTKVRRDRVESAPPPPRSPPGWGGRSTRHPL